MDEIVSDFLVNSCHLKRQPNVRKLVTWQVTEKDKSLTPVGSASNVYIEPLVGRVSEIDFLECSETAIAIPSIDQVPQLLPTYFRDNVDVTLMIDAEFPSYVQLLIIGRLYKSFTGDKFKFNASPTSDSHLQWTNAGQLAVSDLSGRGLARLDSDSSSFPIYKVRSIRCLEWPAQAARWSARSRKYGWPDSAIVQRAINMGCDVVKAAHCQWMQDMSIRDTRWKISFARAETVLLHSWTPKQQLVYNILRSIIRISGLSDLKSDDGDMMMTLTTYHIKTVMLWSCEQKPPGWWIKLNVVQLSGNVLQFLKDCCVMSKCPGYFVKETNLFENTVPLFLISRLQSFTDSTFLTSWLINNYIRSADDCPQDVVLLFDDVSTHSKLQSALNAFKHWKLEFRLEESLHQIQSTMRFICKELPECSRDMDVITLTKWLQELKNVDERLSPAYAVPMFFFTLLPVSNLTSFSMSLRLLHIVTEILTDHEKTCTKFAPSDLNVVMLQKAIHLLLTSQRKEKPYTVRSSICIILTYFYLRIVVKQTTNNNQWVSCLADVYLAVLYYITGQYQKSVKHCKRTMTYTDSPSMDVIDAGVIESRCLPKISDEVDNVSGLTVLYQYICGKAFNLEAYPIHVNVFNARLFAHYLMLTSQCSRKKDNTCEKRDIIKRYKTVFSNTLHPFATDLLLFYMCCNKSLAQDEQSTRRTKSISLQFKFNELIRLIVDLSVEHLTSFREILLRDFGSVCLVATKDYEAMHAYQRGKYDRCLTLCRQIIVACGRNGTHLVVPMTGCMTHLMDNNLACVSASVWLHSKDADKLHAVQITISVYLELLGNIQLRYPLSSLVAILQNVKKVHERHAKGNIFDRLLLCFAYRKAIIHIAKSALNV
jgi:Mab-21 protein